VGLLPPVSVPFAARPMRHVRPDLWPLSRALPPDVEDDGPPDLVRFDAEVPELVAAARTAVTTDSDPWTAHTDDLDPRRAEAAGLELGRAVARVAPRLVSVEGEHLVLPGVGLRVGPAGAVDRVPVSDDPAVGGDPVPVAERLARVVPEHRYLEAVALGIGEDVVLVGGDARALWLHVCAPSGWDPGAAAGSTLTELHGPVPAAERLRAASRALGRAIVTSGPHVRWVWGLTDDPAAAHHPRFRGPPAAGNGEVGDLTFRAERQTTLPLPHLELGVFLIRVHRTPLAVAASTARRRAALADTIGSLPAELARYKGVAERRSELLAWLAADPGPPQ
jgi:hypothetical protein